jgi:DUF4097 and DUF4098 domain-containing protein YvlB
MLSKLLLGALVVAVAPQEPQEPVSRIESHEIEITIPDIRIPEHEIDISFPAMAFHMDGFEMHFPEFDMDFPSFTIAIPDFGHLDWMDGWHADDVEWDVQDTEMDTTLDVSRGARLELRNHAGEVVIRSWNRNQVRVRASYSSDDRVKIFSSASTLNIKSEARHGHPDAVDYELTVPDWMGVDLWGFYTDISVDGVGNDVRVETLEGDIEVRNSRGEIYLQSVEGDVVVQRSGGRLAVHNVDGEVNVLDFEGGLVAESIDGDITVEGVSSASVEAKTVDGDILYAGAIADDGRYKLTTHDGDVVVRIPNDANATVSVATFDGEFEAEFPVQLEGTQASRKFNFVIGNGSARLELHTFAGDIQLLRR